MTKKEFEEGYAARSNMSVEALHNYGLFAAPCDCGEESCNGWRMITETTLAVEDTLKKITGMPVDFTKILNKS